MPAKRRISPTTTGTPSLKVSAGPTRDVQSASTSFTFDQLLAAFFVGIEDEASRTDPPLAPPMDRPALETYLRRVYRGRFNLRQSTLPANTLKCAETLGRITFVMYRSQFHHEDADEPIDVAGPDDMITVEHIQLAREMYGHYTNTGQTPRPKNALHGVITLAGEPQFGKRETDEPCPLCP
jgi:hypothetical protein